MGIFSNLFGTDPFPQRNEPHTTLPGFTESERAEFSYGDESDEGPDYAEPEDYEPLPVLTLRPWDYGQGVDPDAYGFGFETPDGRIWPAGQCQWNRWDELGVLVINVIGEKYHLKELRDRSFDPGRPLTLVPEPDNPYDPKAISIRNASGSLSAGYLKKGSTSRLRNMVRDQDFRVMSLSYRLNGRREREQLKVVIFRPDRLKGAEHIPPHPAL